MRFLFFAFLFNFIFLINLYSSNIITIQTLGISVIGDRVDKCRKNAIDNAIDNGIKKIINSKLDSETLNKIKNEAVVGYEVLQENIEGNILKENIKLVINKDILNTILKKKYDFLKIVIAGFEKDQYSKRITNFLQNILDNINNLSIICIKPNFISDNLTSLKYYSKGINRDFIIILKSNYQKIKVLESVNKIYANLDVDLIVYDKNFNKLKEFTFDKKVILNENDFYLNYLKNSILSFLDNNLKNLLKIFVSSNKVSSSFVFTLIDPKNYSIIKSLLNIFDSYNIQFSWNSIEAGKVNFIIKNFSKNKLIDILKSNNFNGNYNISMKEGENGQKF